MVNRSPACAGCQGIPVPCSSARKAVYRWSANMVAGLEHQAGAITCRELPARLRDGRHVRETPRPAPGSGRRAAQGTAPPLGGRHRCARWPALHRSRSSVPRGVRRTAASPWPTSRKCNARPGLLAADPGHTGSDLPIRLPQEPNPAAACLADGVGDSHDPEREAEHRHPRARRPHVRRLDGV